MDGTPFWIDGLPVIHEDGHFRLPKSRNRPCRSYGYGCECEECRKRAAFVRPPTIRQPWDLAA